MIFKMGRSKPILNYCIEAANKYKQVALRAGIAQLGEHSPPIYMYCKVARVPRLGASHGGLTFLVVSSVPRGFPARTLVFPSPQKPTFDLICAD